MLRAMAVTNTAQRALAYRICRVLRQAGHVAYLAGGCVRDELMGFDPKDYDVATDARPERVEEVFSRTVPVGKAFGVVIVVDEHEAVVKVEVATFRNDGAYVDGRRPESVVFSSPREDAERRDFTINGMFRDTESGEVIDFVGGRADLDAKVVRAIGDATARFTEDKLRMLRGVRFACRFNFALDPATEAAAARLAPMLSQVSAERIRDELNRMLEANGRGRAFTMLAETGLLAVALPEFTASAAEDPRVFPRTLAMLDMLGAGEGALMPDERAQKVLAWSVLLHGVTPEAAMRNIADLRADYGDARYSGDRQRRARAAWRIMWRLKHSREECDAVADAALQTGMAVSAQRMGLAELKRFLRQPGTLVALELDRLLAVADTSATRESARAVADAVAFCKARIAAFSAAGATNPLDGLHPPQLADGETLKHLGAPQGPVFRQLLHDLETETLEGRVRTGHDAEAYLKKRLAERNHP
jgi:tRNA nucleotidyltransferase/poly(A) polymerase